ncbi:hypothetical protein COMA1_70021 [Candidatus Nitrospira nitrosa]|uniref:Uncharacterized protein n=1 Tax=Candidatus Nitrospira nitrosa TaxID=1742972 RepID=A0A0S4LR45_9BACT|nr:hypothetical protein COMA1_70021 [Candidatus Nitrospira nitrosa]
MLLRREVVYSQVLPLNSYQPLRLEVAKLLQGHLLRKQHAVGYFQSAQFD